MRLMTFESFEEPKKRELRPRPEKEKVKRCIGKCERKFYMKDGKPVIHCPSCDRIISI
jgi:hypothetical protein